jgi:hypothetical protein
MAGVLAYHVLNWMDARMRIFERCKKGTHVFFKKSRVPSFLYTAQIDADLVVYFGYRIATGAGRTAVNYRGRA